MTSNELEIFKQSILDDVRVMMQTTGQVTQYIGARYVPLFAEPLEWSNTKEYEPLTIVLHQGNSFTSRQFVPKGISIDNTEFWASTGNYNAQIEQYRQELELLKKKTDKLSKIYVSLDNLKADETVEQGAVVLTMSRNGISQGGGYYVITDDEIPNDMDVIEISSNKQAKLIISDYVNVEQLGASTSMDITSILQYALDKYKKVHVNQGLEYNISDTVRVKNECKLFSDNLGHVGDPTSPCTFNWVGGENKAAIAMVTNEKSPLVDEYPEYGAELLNLSINGNNKLSLGFLVTGQQTCYVDEIMAVNCTIGICITRAWNFNIGNIHAFYCELGVSTIPAFSLSPDTHKPIIVSGVSDSAVNNLNIDNITIQQCGCGMYINVMLQTNINVIDIEKCKTATGYGLKCISAQAFFSNVHIEHYSDLPLTHSDLDFTENFANRIPAFGAVQCSTIKTDIVSPHIDTLIPYRNSGEKYVVFDGALVSRPLVECYSVKAPTDWIEEKYIPKMRVSAYQDGTTLKGCTSRNKAFIIVNNTGNSTASNISIEFNPYGGYTPDTITIPEISANQFIGKAITLGYIDKNYPVVSATCKNTADVRAFICECEFGW